MYEMKGRKAEREREKFKKEELKIIESNNKKELKIKESINKI